MRFFKLLLTVTLLCVGVRGASFLPASVVGSSTANGELCLAQQTACADLNGDGHVEALLVTSRQGGCVGEKSLFSFSYAPAFPVTPVNILPSPSLDGARVRARDYDQDGDVDLLVGDFGGGAFTGDPQNKLRVLTNNGAGSMSESVIVDSVFPSIWMTWANVDNNAGVDIVALGVVHSNAPPPTPAPVRHMKIFLESSGFAPSISPVVSTATANSVSNVATGIQAADVNNDNFDDLVVAATDNVAMGYYLVLNTQITPFFDLSLNGHVFFTTPSAPNGNFVLGDFDGDSRVDFAVLTAGDLILYMHSGVTTSAAVIYPTATTISSGLPAYDGIGLVAGDLNADGRLDLVFSQYDMLTSSLLFAWMHSGDVSSPSAMFATSTLAQVAAAPVTGSMAPAFSSASICDFNRDGLADVVASTISAFPASNSLYAVLQAPAPTTPTTTAGSTTAGSTTAGPTSGGSSGGGLLGRAYNAPPVGAIVGGVLGGCCCCILLVLLLVAWHNQRRCPHRDCTVDVTQLSKDERRAHVFDFDSHRAHFAAQLATPELSASEQSNPANCRCLTCKRLVKESIWPLETSNVDPTVASTSCSAPGSTIAAPGSGAGSGSGNSSAS